MASNRRVSFLSLVRIVVAAYVCRCTSVQVDGHEVGAVVFQIQSTDRRAPAGYTQVAITCPASSHSETVVWLTHSLSHRVSADGIYDIVLALPDC